MTLHIVGFSGGVDSQACALWVRQRFDPSEVLLLNSDPGGHEHPLTYLFIQDYSTNVFPVTTVKPIVADMDGREPGKIKQLGLQPTDELTFTLLGQIKGRYPSTKARFCTHHLKLLPQVRWIRENVTTDYDRWIGVRRDESRGRADVAEVEWDDLFDCQLHRPLATWTKQQCFEFLAQHGEDVNPLYRMGSSRVGCSPCINSGKDDIREWAARFPEEVEKVRRMEQAVGRTFFPPVLPGGRYGFVDEVIAWSKTVRGGVQLAIPTVERAAEAGECSSRYGLCE